MTQSRRPSPLQRRVLIVLAALDEKRPGPVLTRDIERVLERSGEAPVYGPNLRASCRRLEDAGWLRTLRAPNLQLAGPAASCGADPGRNGAGRSLQGPAGILAVHHEPSTSGGVPALPDNRWQRAALSL